MSGEKQLLARVGPLAEEYGMFPRGGTVLCCVSGGVDSVSLLHFLASQAGYRGFGLHACHLDHAIRPGSGADADFVAAQCAQLGVPLHQKRENVPALAQQWGVGLEEAGRRARYAFFDAVAAKLPECVIATAHNADDNVETLLLHLVRGCGLSGLGGIPPRRGNLVRPFLNVPRALIEDYAQEKGLAHVEDESNADTAYSRNFLRHEVLPLLRKLNPSLTDTLSATAASLRQDGDFLTARAQVLAMDAATAAGSVILPLGAVTGQSAAIAGRVIQAAAQKLEPELVLTAQQRRTALEVCRGDDPSGHVDLPGGMSAQRVYDTLVFSYPGRVEILPPTPLDFDGERDVGPWRVTVAQNSVCPEKWQSAPGEFYLPAGEAVLLRPRQEGDELKLARRSGTKSLKKWFIETRVPEARRALVPVLARGNAVLGVQGLGTAQDAMPQPGDAAIHITIREKEREQIT